MTRLNLLNQHVRQLAAVIFLGALSVLPLALAQPGDEADAAASQALQHCGSVVLVQCRPQATTGRDANTPDRLQAARSAGLSEPGAVVIQGQRARHDPIKTVFERSLKTGAYAVPELLTYDKGAGVRCTVSPTGQSICSRGAQAAPNVPGIQTDWSDWFF